MEKLEAQLEATTADSEQQVAEAQQTSIRDKKEGSGYGCKGDAEAVALSLQRETVKSRNLAELHSDMEVCNDQRIHGC